MNKLTGFNNVPTRFALSRRVRHKNGKKFVYYDNSFKGVTTVDAGFYYCPWVPVFKFPACFDQSLSAILT